MGLDGEEGGAKYGQTFYLQLAKQFQSRNFTVSNLIFILWITRSVRNKLLWALRYANVSHKFRHLSWISRPRTKATDVKTAVVDRSRSTMSVLILYISQESQDDCLHVDFCLHRRRSKPSVYRGTQRRFPPKYIESSF